MPTVKVGDVLENYPRETFAVLDGAGHNLQIEKDQVFTALVRDWLNRVLEAQQFLKPEQ